MSLGNHKLQFAFGCAILILLVVGAISYHAIIVAGESDQWVGHTHDVLEDIQDLRLAMESSDSNSRAFLLTGNEAYLVSYRANLVQAEQDQFNIRSLTADNQVQQRRMPALRSIISEKIARSDIVNGIRRSRGLAAAATAVESGMGQRLTNNFLALTTQLQVEELRLLALRDVTTKRLIRQAELIMILGVLLGMIITGVAGWNAQRDSSVRVLANQSLALKVDELKRSNEELEQFANIASHDLQEPLRMVASYTQLLSRRYKGKLDSDADEFIAFAVDGATRMQQLIQDLLAYSRVGTKGSELVDISSGDALQQALINLRAAIVESNAVVSSDLLPMVMADETQLIQLFQNLIGNAIKYQAGGIPRVHISAAMNGSDRWKFSVKDNGLGIDPQFFERIFGMFQRLHKREEFTGTGIGLAICKKIVERHGGSISVESTLGQGSTFYFLLMAG